MSGTELYWFIAVLFILVGSIGVLINCRNRKYFYQDMLTAKHSSQLTSESLEQSTKALVDSYIMAAIGVAMMIGTLACAIVAAVKMVIQIAKAFRGFIA